MQPAAHHIPASTYRLQLSGHLRLDEVRQLVPYFHQLGIGALYFSPLFRAVQGSTHGYDIVDHRQIDPAIGTEQDLEALAAELKTHGMGLVLDLVPNHMGIDDPHNAWWRDVLENGQCSPYARFFDIDWSPPKLALHGKILLATLGDQFGVVLEDQQLKLAFENYKFVIRIYERSLPTDPRTWRTVLERSRELLLANHPLATAEADKLVGILDRLSQLPTTVESDPSSIKRRQTLKTEIQQALSNLVDTSAEVRESIDTALAELNGVRGDLASFNALEAFLDDQPYRLCYWRVATEEINYRRFFDVDSLAAIRVEDPEVFEAVHETVLRYIERGWVTGLRIDHADGLLDPQQYLASIAERAALALSKSQPEPTTETEAVAASNEPSRVYLLVEKILGQDESLPREWPVDGTTGYEYLNLLNSIFVPREGLAGVRSDYFRFVGSVERFAQVLYESKRTILSTSLSSELNVLSDRLVRIAEQHRWSRDFTRIALSRALREIVACFPVYRTYIRDDAGNLRDEDRRRIMDAVRIAKRRNPAMSATFFDFITSVLLLVDPSDLSEEARQARRQFVLKLQQVTGPVTAKGLEDTTFYRFYPLASLNEVGGGPDFARTTTHEFHDRVLDLKSAWPNTMVSTGTHDTKRGEDMRARLNVLAEVPLDWEAAIKRWHDLNAAAFSTSDGSPVPDANEEYLIYQTLVGTWPTESLDATAWQTYVDRIKAYLEKALREGKLNTSWLNPNPDYEQGIFKFVETILESQSNAFATDMTRFVGRISTAGFINSLAQSLLKICVPGVPDFYQGVEFWDFNLVDPDNRRPVNFAERQEVLTSLQSQAEQSLPRLAQELLSHWPDKRLKLFAIWRALQFRAAHLDLFRSEYLPLEVTGQRRENILAFARRSGTNWALCIVPRAAQNAFTTGNVQSATLSQWFADTTLVLPPEAPQAWQHVLTGPTFATTTGTAGARTLNAAEIFATFPVALLNALESRL